MHLPRVEIHRNTPFSLYLFEVQGEIQLVSNGKQEWVLGSTKDSFCKPRERAPAALCPLSGSQQHTSTVFRALSPLTRHSRLQPLETEVKAYKLLSILRNRVCFPNALTDTNQPWPQHSFKGPEHQPRPGTGHTTTIRNSQATSTNIQDSGFMLIKIHPGVFTVFGQS